jgi:hypothetical protein
MNTWISIETASSNGDPHGGKRGKIFLSWIS